jgi:hypothetical protein
MMFPTSNRERKQKAEQKIDDELYRGFDLHSLLVEAYQRIEILERKNKSLMSSSDHLVDQIS